MKKVILISLMFLSACTFQTKHRGYVFPQDLETQVKSIKTVAQLEDKIGFPQAKTIYGDKVWIYWGEDENYHGPFPLTYSNKAALLAWVKGDKVVKVRILRDKDLPKITMASGETAIPAAVELNAFQELFNNIGRFSPAGVGQ